MGIKITNDVFGGGTLEFTPDPPLYRSGPCPTCAQLHNEIERLQKIETACKAWLADNLRCGYQGLLHNILDGIGPKP